MEDVVTVDEGGSSGEVGSEVEKGKRRKVLRRERFSRRNEAFGRRIEGGASGRRRLMRSSLLCLVGTQLELLRVLISLLQLF